MRTKKEENKRIRKATAESQIIRLSSLNHKINRKAALAADCDDAEWRYACGACSINEVEVNFFHLLETLRTPIGAYVGRYSAIYPVRDYHGREVY